MLQMKGVRNKDNKDNKENKESRKQGFLSIFRNETLHFAIGLVLMIFMFYLLVAFVSFFFTGGADQSLVDGASAADLATGDVEARNLAGAQGARLADRFINGAFGASSFFLVLLVAAAGIKLMRIARIRLWRWFIVCSVMMVWTSLFLAYATQHLLEDRFFLLGGLHGYNINRWLEAQIGTPGVALLLLVTALLLMIYLSARTVVWLRTLLGFGFLRRRKKETAEAEKGTVPEEFTTSWTAPKESEKESDKEIEETDTEDEEAPSETEAAADGSIDMQVEVAKGDSDDKPAAGSVETTDFTVEQNPDEAADMEAMEPYNPRLDLENYKFPTIDLMKHFDNDEPSVDMDEQNANKDRIIETLRSFGIGISSIKATVGPTVTLYEIKPEEGIRISRIRNLEDDIALSLSALGIRIIAPMPGKGTIGIEVPNMNPKIVSGQSIIGSKKFQETTFDLPLAFGKTISNEVFMVDLCKMPHILVAGATGQGKSVGLNAMITSLLYKKHPSELKFVLVDPKKVEFSIYSKIERHFLAELPDSVEPIVTDVKKVVQTLTSICVEMDARYDLLKLAGLRNIKEYNQKFIDRRLNPEKGHRYLPYIVVVIDEFGDLIMTAGREVELPIARIAQLARAVGIHMIIATQRPTTNIITGTIKANFPARVAFRVGAMIDSRTILDRSGANQLIGRGDMLYLNGSDPVRVQCAFIDTPEVQNIVDFISQQQGYPMPFYLPEVAEVDDGLSGDGGAADVDMDRLDSMFEAAARLVVIHQLGSTSLIQRKFKIGYNRAGRIMDQMEQAGIVGPSQGSKPRDVLCVDETDLQMKLNNLNLK